MRAIAKLPWLLLVLNAACTKENIADPGFYVVGTLGLAEPRDLSWAPVIVQIYPAGSVDDAGGIAVGARPFFAYVLSGPLDGSTPLSIDAGTLGCGRPGQVLAWIDVDGSAAEWGQGGWEYVARPGVGDLVALPAPLRFTGPGPCPAFGEPVALVASRTVTGVPSPLRTSVRVTVDMTSLPGNAAPLQIDAYRPEDLEGDLPCAGCAPLFSFREQGTQSGFAFPYPLDAPRGAVPLRLFAHTEVNGVTFSGADAEGTLFAGEDGTRSRAAVGITIGLVRR